MAQMTPKQTLEAILTLSEHEDGHCAVRPRAKCDWCNIADLARTGIAAS